MLNLTTPVPAALVAELEKRFPAYIPTPDTTIPKMWHEHGTRWLVAFLRQALNEQEQDAITKMRTSTSV